MEITQGRGAVKSFCLCNAFKYLWRHNRKNGVEDIKKARWYLDKYIELAEEEDIPICKELKKVADEDLSKKLKEAFSITDLDTLDISRDAGHLKPIWTDQMTKNLDASKEEKEDLYNAILKDAVALRKGPTVDPKVMEEMFKGGEE